jgi:hypothetical protein
MVVLVLGMSMLKNESERTRELSRCGLCVKTSSRETGKARTRDEEGSGVPEGRGTN